MKLLSWRNDLNLRLTREFRYGFSGIFRRYIEMPDLSEGGRASTRRRNRYCSVDSRALSPIFQVHSCSVAPLWMICALS
jgi:hypothetical protein